MTHLSDEPASEERPPAGPRFTYASGDRPLEGYSIKRGVGRGGFGEVYYGVSDAGKEVALKLIRRNLDVELRGVTQCLNLKHPNLVALYDIRTDENGDRWVVMEYVSGESLEDVIERFPNGMPTDLAIEWFSGIAAGVAHLHDHGIVHRDLKPANIFLDEGTVKIGDYGLSKFISCSRRSGQTESVGTVHYMAPEIANGRYGKEIDTYALGVMLYEMLTGHVPFEGESVGEVLMKHLTAEPDLGALEEPYRQVVQGALAKDPEARIRNVSDMLDSMASLGGGGNKGEKPIPPFARKVAADGSPSVNPSATMAAWPGERTAGKAAPLEEPVLAAVKREIHMAREDFSRSSMHPLIKSALGVGVVIALVATSTEWLFPATVIGIVYLIYRAFWTIVIQPSRAPASMATSPGRPPAPSFAAPAVPAALADPPMQKVSRKKRRQLRLSRQRQLREHVGGLTLHDRMGGLLGGMLLSAVVSAIASLLVCLIVSNPFNQEMFAWMAGVCTFGSWAIMIPTRLTEGKVEDQAPLRFIQLITGAAVGVLAWALADWLLLSLGGWNSMGIQPGGSLFSSTLGIGADFATQKPLQVFAAYFAFLFVLVTWWEQAESTRTSRVCIWDILWCGLIAWLLHFVWWFPQPLGFLLAGIMSFTLQFSSPWLPPSRRREIAEQEVTV